jgi:release factor glutamine methyltransferase
MRTLLEILQLSTHHLEKSGIAHARRQAEELMADALGTSRMQLYLEHDRPLQEDELSLIRESLARRAKGEPNPYIRGLVDFHDCQLKVTPDVLIPRQETGVLVDRIIQELRHQDLTGKRLLDLCCGPGCIGIALKKCFPDLTVILADLCPKALQLARENAERERVAVEFLQGDLLQPFQGRKAHYLVCNPPYLSESEYLQLDREVREFEPRLALVGGATGLEFYEKLAKELPLYLEPGARLWFEMGHAQGAALLHLFGAAPWKGGRVLQDWSGHDRFFSLENE